ncbi:hypothetical protein [Nocardia sp. NBC_01009]|uniref:hypothetical protein n=1 Tax=Nocardia sp. NBC_01009 TaxID=2975996 RepID=UPI00386BF1DA|nr:hypothetical protein OHA42_04895 [Nocardia sp. NBC_01009]
MIGALRATLLPIEIDRLAATILQVGALFAALGCGVDYLAMPDDVEVRSLGFVEAALPFAAWGAAFFAASVVGLAGLAMRRFPVAAVAHGTLMGLYLAFGIGQLLYLMSIGDTYGWRTGVGWILGGALIHAVLAEAALDASRRSRG